MIFEFMNLDTYGIENDLCELLIIPPVHNIIATMDKNNNTINVSTANFNYTGVFSGIEEAKENFERLAIALCYNEEDHPERFV